MWAHHGPTATHSFWLRRRVVNGRVAWRSCLADALCLRPEACVVPGVIVKAAHGRWGHKAEAGDE